VGVAKIPSDATAARIVHLLNEQGAAGDFDRAPNPKRWVFVRCDSATAVGGDAIKNQCYPGTMLLPRSWFTVPPVENTRAVLLTLIGDSGNPVVPVAGRVYECLLADEVESDRTGSGPSLVNGRPRCFGVPGGVPGSGTDNHITRWDGTSAVQDSLAFLGDDGSLATPGDVTSIYGTLNYATLRGTNDGGRAMLILGVRDGVISNLCELDFRYHGAVGDGVDLLLPYDINFTLKAGDPTSGHTITNAYALQRGTTGAEVTHVGVDGTLGPGAAALGGIITSVGSGSFPSLAANNTWTGTNSFTGAVTMPMVGDVVPLAVQGGGAGTSNIIVAKTAGGSTALSLSGAGVLTADGSGLTNIGAGSLTGGAKAAITALTPCYAYLN
jgi:hypothetical protein